MATADSFPSAPVFAFDAPGPPGGHHWAALMEVAGVGAVVLPDEAVSQTLELSRARVAAGLAADPAWVRFRLDATRSAGEGSYIGVDGEAFVPRVDEAAAGARWRGLSGEVGLVADPWIAAGNRAWALDALLPTFASQQAWIASSDAGLAVRWQDRASRVAIDATLVTGEGANRRERNEGKDVAGGVSTAPLGNAALVVSLYGRYGSRGAAYAPQNRVGARVAGEVGRFGYGLEGLKAWGVETDGSREPVELSAWVSARPVSVLLVAGRADVWSEDTERDDAMGWRAMAGSGVRLPLPDGALHLLIGVDHEEQGEGIAPFPGGDTAGSSTTTLFLHAAIKLGARDSLP
jgi:hypothetical protein